MAVQSFKRDIFHCQDLLKKLRSLPGLNRHAELTVHLTGVYRLKGMRIDPRCDTQQHLLPDTLPAGNFVEPFELLVVINNKTAYTAVNGIFNFCVGFEVAVKIEFFRRNPPGGTL